MDVIVTIPKSRLAEVEAEEKQVAEGAARGEVWCYYWTLAAMPKHLKIGERCYFVWDGAIRAWHKVKDIEPGYHLTFPQLWLEPEIHTLEKPVPMKGFRGFRYVRNRRIFADV